MYVIYFTSDLHFFHQKEFLYGPRGFTNAEDMNNAIIQNFNSIVKYEDDVYMLGDLLLGGSEKFDEGMNLIAALNGRLHLVRGNHDTDKRWNAYKTLHNVVETENAIYLNYTGYHFYLSHYPTLTSNHDYDKPLKARLINLCGHTHIQDKFADWGSGYIYHCELDAHNNYPVSIETIIQDLKNKIQEENNLKNKTKWYYEELKVNYSERISFIRAYCDKCIWFHYGCSGPDIGKAQCPPNQKYKRDPPDGGYYG